MRRLILSPLVGLMMGGACALGVFGIGEGLWAIAFGTPAAVFAAQKAPATTPQSPSSPTGEKE